MIANPDGTGRTLLFPGDHLGPDPFYDLGRIASPSGGWLAVRTFEDPSAMTGPSLELVHVPDGLVPWSTPLLSASLEARYAESDAEAVTAYEAVTLEEAIAWSPDGSQLAMVAALDGPSSDLYVYDVTTAHWRRITSGPNQIATPFWSPDGQWIAHQAVEGFGSGAGWQMGSVWTVSPDGRTLHKLYSPEGGGELFVGWSRGNSLIAYSFFPDGPRNLRAAGAEGAVENILVPGPIQAAAYDPQSGKIAYAAEGAFLWSPTGGARAVGDGLWDTVQWSEAGGRFYFEGPSGVLGVTPGGDAVRVDTLARASPSPDGRYVALWGDGFADRQPGIRLYTSALEPVSTLDEYDVSVVSWRPDSAGLMAMAEAGLTYYPLEGRPQVVDPSATASLEGGLGGLVR